MTYKLESKYPVVNIINPEIQWIVVLGGGQNRLEGMPPNDQLTSASILRLVEGVRLLKGSSNAKLVLSGGSSSGERPEAELLEQLAQLFFIPKQKMVLEIKSIDTIEQARKLVSIVHNKPFYLVTSAIHMPRSMALCQEEGLHPIAAPTDFTLFWENGRGAKLYIPNAYNLQYFTIALHEVLGRLWAFNFKGQ